MLTDVATLFESGGIVEVSILGVLAIGLIAAGAWIFLLPRPTAAQRERKRRLTINQTGRMGDATILDVRDNVLCYSYEVGGVGYTASQDASDFKHLLPAVSSILAGPAGLKYSAKNPANSIVICEEWSGLRATAPQFQESQAKENIH